jgi:tRNA-uridine 2-sulfurtransferase
MTKALGMLSGGLDSILACKILMEQGIEVVGVTYISPFFSEKNGREAAEQLGIELKVVDITDELLDVIRKPKYGFGKGVNPCIDCHGLMFRTTGQIIKDEGFDFMFSGEVLNQRPMSQNNESLKKVLKLSENEDSILRPLSAKLLPETLAEKEGKVDRERLLDLSGKGRKRQFELAEKYGIKNFPTPAGGCRLTNPQYTKRFKPFINLEKTNKEIVRDLKLLLVGRHIKLFDENWVIVGRNESDNNALIELADVSDVKMYVKDYVGPVLLIVGNKNKDIINDCASICVRYSDVDADLEIEVVVEVDDEKQIVKVKACGDDFFRKYLI